MPVRMSIFLLFDSQLTVIGAGTAERVGLIRVKPYHLFAWILLISELKPSLIENVGSEKLFLY